MKKFLSLILALVMVCSLSATAFAAEEEDGPGGSTTLLTTVPDTPLYTLNIPADQTIVYGATETNIGKATVTDVNSTVDTVYAECTWTDFSDGSNTIPMKIVFDSYIGSSITHKHTEPTGVAQMLWGGGFTNRYCEYFVQISESDWAAAVPGDYTATITWTSTYELK